VVQKSGEDVVQILYDQIRDLNQRINTLQSTYDQIKDADVNKLITCKTTRNKFSSILSRTTSFINSIQKQFDALIEEMSEVKNMLSLHDKALYTIQKDIHSLMKDKAKAEKDSKELSEKLFKKDADLAAQIKQQEPFRYLLTALIIVLGGLVTLIVNFHKIYDVFKKLFGA
jgi:chromosome segregation ATPase